MITELDLTPSGREIDFVSNVTSGDASDGIDIKEAIPDYRYAIKSITISVAEEKWVQILDGTNPIFGPVVLSAYQPLKVIYDSPVYGTAGNALVLKTQDAFGVFAIIEGKTGLPVPTAPTNPTPSDEATGVSTSQVLGWDSEHESATFNVYFGDDHNSVFMATTASSEFIGNQEETTYDPSLEGSTTYYWRIDEVIESDFAKGVVWSFTTE